MDTISYNRIAEFLTIQGMGGILDNEEIDQALADYLSDSIILGEFRDQSLRAFSVPKFDWKSTLSEYDVYEAEDEEDALSYAKMAVWDYAFPNQPLPRVIEEGEGGDRPRTPEAKADMMNVRGFLATLLAMALSMLPLSACADPPSVAHAGTIRVSIGMPVQALRAGSTYPVPGEGDDVGFFAVTDRLDLIYIDQGREIAFRDLGGPHFFTAVLASQGRVDSVSFSPRRDRLSLDEALQEAQAIYRWFEAQGYRSERGGIGFSIHYANGPESPKPVLTFADARAALLDPQARISEATLVNVVRPDGQVGMGIEIRNSRRMQAVYNPRLDDESRALSERRYSLRVSMGAEY